VSSLRSLPVYPGAEPEAIRVSIGIQDPTDSLALDETLKVREPFVPRSVARPPSPAWERVKEFSMLLVE
jgi:hypothetical protein